jgi:hypothetical protein
MLKIIPSLFSSQYKPKKQNKFVDYVSFLGWGDRRRLNL